MLKVWPRWQVIAARGDPEPYVKRAIYTTYVTWWHRRWTAEVPSEQVPDRGGVTDDLDTVLLRRDLLAAMAGLSRGQRATLGCRFLDDMSVAETAFTLGCSVGTVKSQTARALAALRTTLSTDAFIDLGSQS